MSNRGFTQFFASLEKKPVLLSCAFTVDPSNANGLGVSGLVGAGIGNVFMHTSATPAAGNPNPASGIIMVQFQDNYNKYLFGHTSFLSPLSGTSISISTGSSLTVGNPYVITALGTTTTAQWNAVGVPVGIVPAIGVSFIASATSGAGTGTVQAPSNSGIETIEALGSPNTTITSKAATVLGVTSGAYMLLQCLKTDALTAPAAGTVIQLGFFLSNSVITVKGQ